MKPPDRARGQYVERVRTLAPLIEAWADQAEQEGPLPQPLPAARIDAGLFRLLLPRSLGGAELDPVTFVEIIEEVSTIDASCAWCLCGASGCSMVAAYLRPDVAAAIFANDPRALLAAEIRRRRLPRPRA